MARLVISILHRDYFDIICASPPELNGIHLLDVIKDGKFDVLTTGNIIVSKTNISTISKCRISMARPIKRIGYRRYHII
jgi:hypothetical protein